MGCRSAPTFGQGGHEWFFAGAELRTGARPVAVERGLDRAVQAVELEGGERIETATVLSTLDPKSTVALFERIPQRLNEQIQIFRCSGTTAVLRLALQGACGFASRPGQAVAAARTGGSIDQVGIHVARGARHRVQRRRGPLGLCFAIGSGLASDPRRRPRTRVRRSRGAALLRGLGIFVSRSAQRLGALVSGLEASA